MRFLVVDDDWLTRGGVVKAIESIEPDAAVAEASSLHDAYTALQENPATDLVILDLNLKESRGIDTLVEFRHWCESQHIEPRTVVLSGASDDNPNLVADVLANHGTGFILKGTGAKVFEHALAMTVEGGVFVPEEILRAIARRPGMQRASGSGDGRATPNFTPKETEIAALLIQGMTYKKIAQVLEKRHAQRISENTVRTHVGNMAWKLGVTTNAKAGVMAEIAKRGLKFRFD
jgi:two-component system, NarL family, nitrate/nitrite response regulator NarL